MTDDQERRAADEIGRSYPNWVVLWGCYTRLFWAFPHFPVPKGTIVSAPGLDGLLADMHSVELEVRTSQQAAVDTYSAPREAAYNSQQTAPYGSSPSPAELPRRLSRRQAPRGALAWVAATKSHVPYATDPYESDPYSSAPYDCEPYESNAARPS